MKVRKTIVGSQIGVQPPGGEDRQHPSPTSLSTCLEVSERLKSFSRPRLHSSQASALTLPLLSHANMPTCCYVSLLRNWDTTQKRVPLSYSITLFEGGVLLALLACVQQRVKACRWGIRCWGALGISYPGWLHWAGKVTCLFYNTVCWTNAWSRTFLHLYTGPKFPFHCNQQKSFRLETTLQKC